MSDLPRAGRVGEEAARAAQLRDELTAARAALADERDARLRAEAALRVARQHDPLTGLPDRSALLGRIERMVLRASRFRRRAAVLVIDLDRFATVNDALGPEAGDLVLRTVATRLRRGLAGDAAYRTGGDEFAVVLEGLSDPDRAVAAGRRVQRILAAPFELGSRTLALTATIGVSVCPDDGVDAGHLLQGADLAMRRAKLAGVHLRRVLHAEPGDRLHELLDLEGDLRVALARGELSLAYQPRLSVETGAVVGAEALLRWHHPTRGDIGPSVFVPMAERARIIDEIGRWALRHACGEAARWRAAGLGDIPVAVNLSPGQMRLHLLTDVEHALAESDLPPHLLELELTEGLVMEPGPSPDLLLETLAARGIRISLDDFGTGFSNLGYLQRLRVAALKIDRSFVEPLGVSPDADAIARAIIALGHALRLRVVAEGIERREQLDLLRTEGCDDYQGFIASPPLEPDDFLAYLGGRPRAA